MAFPKNLLNKDEEIAIDLRPHWAYFLEPGLAILGAIVLALIIQFQLDDGTVEDTLGVITVLGIIAAATWLGIRYLKWTTTNFVVTNDRIIYRHGVFAKSGVQIPLERVMNVNFHQSLFERVVGAGDLLIESGGESGQSRFSDVQHPDQVQMLVHAQIEDNENRKYRLGSHAAPAAPGRNQGAAASSPLPPPPPANVDVADQLERLEGLLRRGSITRAEFESQKAKLIGR